MRGAVPILKVGGVIAVDPNRPGSLAGQDEVPGSLGAQSTVAGNGRICAERGMCLKHSVPGCPKTKSTCASGWVGKVRGSLASGTNAINGGSNGGVPSASREVGCPGVHVGGSLAPTCVWLIIRDMGRAYRETIGGGAWGCDLTERELPSDADYPAEPTEERTIPALEPGQFRVTELVGTSNRYNRRAPKAAGRGSLAVEARHLRTVRGPRGQKFQSLPQGCQRWNGRDPVVLESSAREGGEDVGTARGKAVSIQTLRGPATRPEERIEAFEAGKQRRQVSPGR